MVFLLTSLIGTHMHEFMANKVHFYISGLIFKIALWHKTINHAIFRSANITFFNRCWINKLVIITDWDALAWVDTHFVVVILLQRDHANGGVFVRIPIIEPVIWSINHHIWRMINVPEVVKMIKRAPTSQN